jgi:hypothetical protein
MKDSRPTKAPDTMKRILLVSMLMLSLAPLFFAVLSFRVTTEPYKAERDREKERRKY